MDLLQTEAADESPMLTAEELHQLVVVRADPLQQVTDRHAQLVEVENRVLHVRTQVFFAEGGHAGEAGPGSFGLHACIAANDGPPLGFAFLHLRVYLCPARPLVESLHHSGEDCVLLQLRLSGEDSATLRASVGIDPGLQDTAVAEVVSTWDGDRTGEGTQTDGAGQFILQTHQREVEVV